MRGCRLTRSRSFFTIFRPTTRLLFQATKMATDENCIFCKIIAGKIPSRKFLETEKSYAFLGTLHD